MTTGWCRADLADAGGQSGAGERVPPTHRCILLAILSLLEFFSCLFVSGFHWFCLFTYFGNFQINMTAEIMNGYRREKNGYDKHHLPPIHFQWLPTFPSLFHVSPALCFLLLEHFKVNLDRHHIISLISTGILSKDKGLFLFLKYANSTIITPNKIYSDSLIAYILEWSIKFPIILNIICCIFLYS